MSLVHYFSPFSSYLIDIWAVGVFLKDRSNQVLLVPWFQLSLSHWALATSSFCLPFSKLRVTAPPVHSPLPPIPVSGPWYLTIPCWFTIQNSAYTSVHNPQNQSSLLKPFECSICFLPHTVIYRIKNHFSYPVFII